MRNALEWITSWYNINCDINDEWFQYYGVRIETLDNPGWLVTFDLTETELANKEYTKIVEHVAKCDWLECRVKDNVFVGAGDPMKLSRILDSFSSWAESNVINVGLYEKNDSNNNLEANSHLISMIEWITDWYNTRCGRDYRLGDEYGDDGWYDVYGIRIHTFNVDTFQEYISEKPGWLVKIDITDEELVNKEFAEINEKYSDSDWLSCALVEGDDLQSKVFYSVGDSMKLVRILEIFKVWVES